MMQLQFTQSDKDEQTAISETRADADPVKLFNRLVARIFCEPGEAAAFLRKVADSLDGGKAPKSRKRSEA